MSLHRYAKARDANEPEIVAALRAAGATVVLLDTPCDLLVGRGQANYLIEVKLPFGPRGGSSHSYLTETQAQFAVDWRGQFAVVRSVDEALHVIGLLRDRPPQGLDCSERK